MAQAMNAVSLSTGPSYLGLSMPGVLAAGADRAFPPYDTFVAVSGPPLQPQHHIINNLCDDWNPPGLLWYYYGIEDNFPQFFTTKDAIKSAFPGIKDDYLDQPHRWQVFQVGSNGMSAPPPRIHTHHVL